MNNDQSELFDSSPYYVTPPPVLIDVEVMMWNSCQTLVLTGTPLELFKVWKESQDDDDEQAFLDYVLDYYRDELCYDMVISDWKEIE